MPYAAIDLHVRRSEVLIVDDTGAVLLARRIETQREQFGRLFADRPPMRILLESCTHSEWVAQCLEGYGHDVIVADPHDAPMYEGRVRKIKTDRRDVAALARARVSMPASLSAVLQPLREVLETLADTLRHADAEIATVARQDVAIKRLMTAPGVGPIVAATFHAVLDDPNRFGGDVRRATAFLGLVPREYSSGERRFKGRITKGGPSELRSLLVQASWTIWRRRCSSASGLRAWAHAVAARRGRQVAVVALARRLTRILVAMWRDETDFQWTPTMA